MDYTVRAQRWHILGAAPLAILTASAAFALGQANLTESIWRLNRWAAGLMFAWWFLGIALIRRKERPWATGVPQAARHATRILWGAAVAQLTCTLTMLAAHYLYSGILGQQYAWLDMLVACGALLAGQAAGARTLLVFSRPRPYLYGGVALLCALFLLAALT